MLHLHYRDTLQKIGYPKWYNKEMETWFVKRTRESISEIWQRIDFLPDSPLRLAVLSLVLKKQSIVGFGFTSQDGFWFPAKAFIFDCCSRVNAPTVRNPKGFRDHMKTQKHTLNVLSSIYHIKQEKILEELPPAKMMLKLDPKLEREILYGSGNWYR